MSNALSRSAVPERTMVYESFRGLDTTRDVTALDTGEQQALAACDNAFCDAAGQIVRLASARFQQGSGQVLHIVFHGLGAYTYAEANVAGVDLVASEGPRQVNAYPLGTTHFSATVFNRDAVWTAAGQDSFQYDGTRWQPLTSRQIQKTQPAFFATVNRRLIAAGLRSDPTAVLVSRIDDANTFEGDEPDAVDPDNTNDSLRAGGTNIKNLLGTADEITGIAPWEQTQMIVFTHDRALVVDVATNSLTLAFLSVDQRANVYVGCLSHNTISRAGNDVLFCSRNGVHSIRRSAENGLLVGSVSLSDEVQLLFRQYVRETEDPQSISAVWDQDDGQYHLFFPRGTRGRRLIMTYDAQAQTVRTWATASYLHACAGAFLAGQLLMGTPEGVYESGHVEETEGEPVSMTVRTPHLWHGSLDTQKQTRSLVVQAAGKGQLVVEAFNQDDEQIYEEAFEIEPADTPLSLDQFPSIPLRNQYHRRFVHHYTAVYFVLTSRGTGLLRISGLGINIVQDPRPRR